MLIRDFRLEFSYIALVWFSCQYASLTKYIGRWPLLFHLQEEFACNWYYFSLKCLIECIIKAIRTWSFLCGKILNYKFHFFTR